MAEVESLKRLRMVEAEEAEEVLKQLKQRQTEEANRCQCYKHLVKPFFIDCICIFVICNLISSIEIKKKRIENTKIQTKSS